MNGRSFFYEVNDTLLDDDEELYTNEMIENIIQTIHTNDPSKKTHRHYKYISVAEKEITYSIDDKYIVSSEEGFETNMKAKDVPAFFKQLNIELEEEGLVIFPEKFIEAIKKIAIETRAKMKPLSKRNN